MDKLDKFSALTTAQSLEGLRLTVCISFCMHHSSIVASTSDNKLLHSQSETSVTYLCSISTPTPRTPSVDMFHSLGKASYRCSRTAVGGVRTGNSHLHQISMKQGSMDCDVQYLSLWTTNDFLQSVGPDKPFSIGEKFEIILSKHSETFRSLSNTLGIEFKFR